MRIDNVIILVLLSSCASVPLKRAEINKTELKQATREQLKAFRSDGCSFWPEGTKLKPNEWISCCFIHDFSYWMGGTKSERLETDLNFKKCVAKKGFKNLSELMFEGVRIGGTPALSTSFKWGYGWDYDRGYVPFSKREINYIKNHMPKENDKLEKYLDITFVEDKKYFKTKVPFKVLNKIVTRKKVI